MTLSLKIDVHVAKSGAVVGSATISQRYGSADPDPYQKLSGIGNTGEEAGMDKNYVRQE